MRVLMTDIMLGFFLAWTQDVESACLLAAVLVVLSKRKESGADDGKEGTACRQSLTRPTCTISCVALAQSRVRVLFDGVFGFFREEKRDTDDLKQMTEQQKGKEAPMREQERDIDTQKDKKRSRRYT
jgi:hypothetical protein